jgi:hypothetical protein
MNARVATRIALVAMLVAMMVSVAHAQTSHHSALTAAVPFASAVGKPTIQSKRVKSGSI